jgi:hypothetical protein
VGSSEQRYRRSGLPWSKNTNVLSIRWGQASSVIEDRGSQGPKTRAFCTSSGVKRAALSKIGAPRVQKHERFAPPAEPSVQRYRRSGLPGSKNTSLLGSNGGPVRDVNTRWGSRGSKTRAFLGSVSACGPTSTGIKGPGGQKHECVKLRRGPRAC